MLKKTPYFSSLALTITFIVAATLLYLPSLSGPFVLDDFESIPATNLISYDLQSVKAAIFSNESGPFGRPIAIATFVFNHYFFGTDPYSFKIVNLIVHITCALLLALLSKQLLHYLGYSKKTVFICASLTGLLWLIHPLQLSTVSYIVQRMTQLMTLFTTISLCAYTAARTHHCRTDSLALGYFFIVIIASAMAVLSKENGVLILVYVILLELLVFKFEAVTVAQKHLVTIFLTVFSVIPLILGVLYFIHGFESIVNGYDRRPYSMDERIITQFSAITHYLKLIIIPSADSMNLYNDAFPLRNTFDKTTTVSALIITSLVGSTIYLRNKLPLYSLGIALYIASHLIESTIFPLELVWEHRNYFGIYGLTIAFVTTVKHFTEKLEQPVAVTAIGAACLLAIGYQTYTRADIWGNEIDLHIAAIEKQPNSERASLALVAGYMKNNRYDLARDHLDKQIENNSSNSIYQLSSVQIDCISGNSESKDIKSLNVSLPKFQRKDHALTALAKLQTIYNGGHCGNHGTDTIKGFYHALLLENSSPASKNTIRVGAINLAGIYLQDGEIENAIQLLEKMKIHESGKPEFLVRMAWLYAINKQTDKSEFLISKLENEKNIDLFKNDISVIEKQIQLNRQDSGSTDTTAQISQ